MAFAGNRLLAIRQVYQVGDSAYEGLSEKVRGSGAPRTQPTGSGARPVTPKSDIPDLGIDFEALRGINKDAVAWLYSPDTPIDYPVMAADDYSYYLSHLPDGTQNANGSLFIDYNNASDFSEKLTVIYGHHMRSGAMFGNLNGYKTQDYYDQHPTMYLYTDAGNYKIDLLYGVVIGAGQWRARAFMYEVNVGELLSYGAYNSTFKSTATYEEGDRFIALSTCSYEFDNARQVVLGVLRPE
jgi:sortase B